MTTKEQQAKGLQAFLIHKAPTGDTSFRIRFFTHEHGVIDCHYRGGRTPKKNALLDPFAPLWIHINERHQWHYVNTVESAGLPYALKGKALFAALYINELIYHTAARHDPETPLFIAYNNTLCHLQHAIQTTDIEIGLRQFEKALLTTTGYSLSLEPSSQLAISINPSAHYQFIVGQGFREVNSGFTGEDILAFAHDEWNNPSVLKMAKTIMRLAIADLLGGQRLQSRELFTTTYGNGPPKSITPLDVEEK